MRLSANINPYNIVHMEKESNYVYRLANVSNFTLDKRSSYNDDGFNGIRRLYCWRKKKGESNI